MLDLQSRHFRVFDAFLGAQLPWSRIVLLLLNDIKVSCFIHNTDLKENVTYLLVLVESLAVILLWQHRHSSLTALTVALVHLSPRFRSPDLLRFLMPAQAG